MNQDCHGTGPHHCSRAPVLNAMYQISPQINLLAIMYKKHSCECQRQAHNAAQAIIQSILKCMIDKTEAFVEVYTGYIPAYIYA